ncbi:hypothetical protein [Nocardioides daejeonensis]|uniref:hypothetical protein n=1 Tax=Nocardioides daejeonensis TaxID=1046556 RepID=UPI000D74F622|nr:hypothetical protein [Nocardioides daejeonensis]
MNTRTALVATALLLMLGGCSDSSAEDDRSTSARTPSAQVDDESFRHEAMRACTQVVNSALGTAGDPGIDIVTARAREEEPSAEQLQEWRAAYDDRLAHLNRMHDALTAVSSEDAAEQAAWDQVVASGDSDLALAEERRDLLATGDWATIKEEFLHTRETTRSTPTPGSPDGSDEAPDDLEEALTALELGRSDCVNAYSLAPIAEGSAEFVSEVSHLCVEVGIRRDEAHLATATGTVLSALEKSLKGAELAGELAGLEPALESLVAEWESTVRDLESVAAAPPDDEAWDDVLAAARERVTVFTRRLEAVRSGDLERVATSLRPDWKHPAVDFEAAGVNRPVCLNATG